LKDNGKMSRKALSRYMIAIRGFLHFCAAKGYTSQNHLQVLPMSKEQLTLPLMISNGIRPVACAQYINKYMPQFISAGRKQNSRAHKKNNPWAILTQLEPASAVISFQVAHLWNDIYGTNVGGHWEVEWSAEEASRYRRFESVRDMAVKRISSRKTDYIIRKTDNVIRKTDIKP
jgi:hypothetical protein